VRLGEGRPTSRQRSLSLGRGNASSCPIPDLAGRCQHHPSWVTLVALVEDLQSSLPDSVRAILKLLVDTFTALEAQIAALDAEIKQRSKSDPTARRLMTIPGVGPIASTAITALVPAAQGFPAGRDFAAWLRCRNRPAASKNSVPFRHAVSGRSVAY
jgi:transposase